MNPRHRARRLALQCLCCLDAQGPEARELLVAFIDDSRESPEALAGARRLMDEAHADWAACDEILARHARHWELPRLALVDRNILRLAAHELRYGKAPPKVVITEAIRLAREFSTADSPRFINGVLDAVAREVRRRAEEMGGGDAGDARHAKRGEEEDGSQGER